MPTSLCSSACYYSLSLWEWWTDTCVQYNHIKDTMHSSSFAVFLEQSLHCCYQITFGTVTSATQLNPLPSTLRLGVAFSSQRVIRMLPSQMSCHPPALASIILTGCLPTMAPTRVTICHPPYHSRGQPPILCTLLQTKHCLATPTASWGPPTPLLMLISILWYWSGFSPCMGLILPALWHPARCPEWPSRHQK